jgi:ATP synthase protein I
MPFRLGEERGRTIRNVGLLSTVGFSFVLAVILGAGLGYLLDRWLGTSPWLFLVFFFVGVVAAIRNVFRLVNRTSEPD